MGRKGGEGSEREAAVATAAAAARGARAHVMPVRLCAPLPLARALPAGIGEGSRGARVREGEAAARPLGAPRVFGSVNGGRDSMCVAAAALASASASTSAAFSRLRLFIRLPLTLPFCLPHFALLRHTRPSVAPASCGRTRLQTYENAEEKLRKLPFHLRKLLFQFNYLPCVEEN